MKPLISYCFLTLICFSLYSQSPNWPAIKSKAKPLLIDSINYAQPYIQPLHNEGWEDGLFVSRNGLHLYAFYLPADLILFSNYLNTNPICPPIAQFIRGPLLGIDTVTNPFGCPSVLHSDIIYSTRNDTASAFSNWQSSNLAHAAEFEGAPQTVEGPQNSLDFFVYTQSDSGQTDIYWYRDTTDNPQWPGTLMPAPINSRSTYEDNPHLERIDDTTLVLFLDDHSSPATDANIYYSISRDNGVSWSAKTYLNSVNTVAEDIQPHLWSDGVDWWLYFVSPDTTDPLQRLSIFRAKQSIAGDWDSWTNRELVISPGTITDSSGVPLAVGEPSLTTWGDISFVLVIQAVGTSDTTDLFEIDPWYVPRKTPISASISDNVRSIESLKIYPNPAAELVNIKASENCSLSVYSLKGELLIEDLQLSVGVNQITLDLPPQLLIFQIDTPQNTIVKKVLLK